MTNVIRWVVVSLLAGHGLIHFLGAAKGFGWAEVEQLEQPIGQGGVVWLLAAVLVLTSAVLVAAGAPTWWWIVAVLAAVVSEVAIVTSWSDAKFGTLANVLLVVAAAYSFASIGPTSFHAQVAGTAARRPVHLRRVPHRRPRIQPSGQRALQRSRTGMVRWAGRRRGSEL